MKASSLEVYRCPACRGDLEITEGVMNENGVVAKGIVTCTACGNSMPVRDEIPSFIQQGEVKGSDLKFQKFYDRISFMYDPLVKFGSMILFGGNIAFRGEFATFLEIKPGDRVLEVSAGSCGNFPFIGTFTGHLDLYGVDISRKFLSRGLKSIKSWKINAELCQGNADNLPYADNSFDCVFHKGGINGFTDKSKAIAEMFRVARPGSLITISDETENMFYAKKQFKQMGLPSFEELGAPVDLIPREAEDVKLIQYARGMMYVITFRKPHPVS